MNQVHLIFLSDRADELASLVSGVTQAGARCTWQLADGPAALVKAVGNGRVDGIVSTPRPWGGDVATEVLAPLAATLPVVILAESAEDMGRAAELLRGGAIDVVPHAESWRWLAALGHVAAHRDRSRLRAERERRSELIDVVKQLSMSHTMEELMAVVRKAARQLTEADGATFVLRDNGFCHYADEDAIAPLWKGQRFPMTQCLSGWAMMNRKPARVEDIFSDPRIPIDVYEPTFVRSVVMVPIRSQDPIGAIGTYWAHRHRATEDEVALLQALADTTAVAIENVNLQTTLERRVQERTEQLRLSNEELEAFSSSVSHDLRNPLNAIDGFAALLEMDLGSQDAAQTRSQLGHIREAARRMNAIIKDLLTLSRAGRGELKRETVDLSRMAAEVLAELQRGAPQRAVDLQIAPGLTADCDAGLMRIALENLLSNAWKYSSKQARACIEFDAEESPGRAPVFCVRDNGAGFDPAKAARLFKPFQRLHPESEFPGVGVGLTTVRRVVQRHGGDIWAQAAPGRGARFYFTLDKTEMPSLEGVMGRSTEPEGVTS